MLSKLLKYEMKSTSRVILPIYLILLTLAIVGRFSIGSIINNSFPDNTISNIFFGLLITAYVFLVFSAFIVTLVVVIQRFYKNITGSEGYLMHTLPVSTHSLLASKMIAAFVWMISTTVMVLLSLAILLVQVPTWESMRYFFSVFGELLGSVFSEVGSRAILTMILLICTVIISTFSSILLIYAAISVGHTFKKHRILGSVLSYIGLTMAAQAIVGIIMSIISVTSPNIFYETFTAIQGINFGNTMLSIMLLLEVCLGTTWYFVSHYILTNQLNLE